MQGGHLNEMMAFPVNGVRLACPAVPVCQPLHLPFVLQGGRLFVNIYDGTA